MAGSVGAGVVELGERLRVLALNIDPRISRSELHQFLVSGNLAAKELGILYRGHSSKPTVCEQ